jgi:hypothetical protein|tara:strand:- start:101 stop:421 length:321 start_codon:yes stop_codon:yes gene_type:complete
MSITIEWKVNDVESVIADGGVTNVKWSCSASGEAGEYAVNGGESVLNPDATASGFISFEDLTESVVIDWAKDSLGEEEVASIEEVLTAKVTAQMTPVTQTGLPWSI